MAINQQIKLFGEQMANVAILTGIFGEHKAKRPIYAKQMQVFNDFGSKCQFPK